MTINVACVCQVVGLCQCVIVTNHFIYLSKVNVLYQIVCFTFIVDDVLNYPFQFFSCLVLN